jgi:hypothetical protein
MPSHAGITVFGDLRNRTLTQQTAIQQTAAHVPDEHTRIDLSGKRTIVTAPHLGGVPASR